MREESRRWESGKPAVGFPLFHPPSSSEMWECGNLAGFWRDFQGARGKSGKPVFGFPRFPQPRHFHSSLWLGFVVPRYSADREWNLSGAYPCAVSITVVETGAASDREIHLERCRRPALTTGQPPSAMPSLVAARCAIAQEQMTSRSHLATARTGL